MKYPLTRQAKEAAIELVQNWNENKVEQWMEISTEGKGITLAGISRQRTLEKIGLPLAGILMELARYGLIVTNSVYDSDGQTRKVQILLLQELRNAVENDFEVSEYFLTMNAVGMIVHGSVHMEPGSVLQTAVTNTGSINQSVEQIVDQLVSTLGIEFLNSQSELLKAIQELKTASEPEKKPRFGKVIAELGNCLGHTANTAAIVSAIMTVAPALQGLL